MTSIHIRDLTVAYGETRVIDGMSLSIEEGEFFTLLGPSGCGKTTLLRTLAGFISPVAGQIAFGETDMTRVPSHKRGIGMVFQDYALFPDRSVFANVAYGLRARKAGKALIQERVHEALEQVGMGGYEDRLPGALSGGQRQRVALARALAIRPSVLLMDEPLSNLDTKLRVSIREAIGDLQRELGITTVFVTHDQEEALALSDRIALFRDGNIEQLGTPDEIYSSPRTSYAASFIGAANVIPVELDSAELTRDGYRVNVPLGDFVLQGTRREGLTRSDAFVVARPENVGLQQGAAADDKCSVVPGEILRHQYLGHKRQYAVRLGNGHVIQSAQSANTPAYKVGDAVSVVFSIDETLVLPS